ncbi:glycoside hydrolase family 38 C-terminal domain-containing protein, partial [Vibrio parahaemolyticus]|nr:glycoside hydrolase family 38 C-terminal domain-containing protein [Vibrio parahaemolyticus]
IENLQTGERIEDPFHFDDTADAGDSFDYSPLKSGDEAIIISDYERGTVTKNDLCQSVELTHTVKLPAKLTGEKRSTEKVEFVIQTKVSLYTGENFIRITHQMNNQVLDHRVRVNWKTGVTDLAKHHADQGYSALERLSTNPYQENWRELGFVEKPMPIYPLESFVALSDEKAHFTFHTGMIKEYQVE